MFGFKDMLGQAKDLQKKMEEAKKNLEQQTFEGTSGAGWVKINMKGNMDITAVHIDPCALEEDKATLEQLIAAAFNSCITQLKKHQKEQNPIPGLDDLKNML